VEDISQIGMGFIKVLKLKVPYSMEVINISCSVCTDFHDDLNFLADTHLVWQL